MISNRLLLLFVLAALASCEGEIVPADPAGDGLGAGPSGAGGAVGSGGAGGDAADPAACQLPGAMTPGPAPIRRLTQREYARTTRDLLGAPLTVADTVPPDDASLGFDNNATVQTVTQVLAEQYMEVAEQLSLQATANLSTFLGCNPATAGERACAGTMIQAFGQRAFRRPLAPAEVGDWLQFYDAQRARVDFPTTIRLVVQAMLQSPYFLYRVEPSAPPAGGAAAALGPYELASRLSYLLWGTMPDDALLASAGRGELASADGVEAAARRMLADPRARESAWDFGQQWLLLRDLDTLVKDPVAYPTFGVPLRTSMKTEAQLFFLEQVLGSGGLDGLLRSPKTFLDPKLAALYGVPAPATAFGLVTLDATQRSGVLTLSGTLAMQGKPDSSDPIHRGKLVREQLLCTQMPLPPPNVPDPPMVDPTLTTRERYAQHRTDPACSSCHVLLDSIGLGFEHYDGIGRFRTTESGKPVDATGELIRTDVDGPFDGAVALSAKLAQSKQVSACATRQWFRYAFGREAIAADACTLAAIDDRFAASSHDFKELLVALTRSDAFRTRLPSP